jgi:hypothetical protein
MTVLTLHPRGYESGTICPVCALPIYPYAGRDVGSYRICEGSTCFEGLDPMRAAGAWAPARSCDFRRTTIDACIRITRSWLGSGFLIVDSSLTWEAL